MVISTALRFTALNGKIRSCDDGIITPSPTRLISGRAGEKSIEVLKGEEREVPEALLSEPSTFSSAFPSVTDPGIIVTMFEFMLIVISREGENQTRPSRSAEASTGSENIISIFLSPSLF